MMIIFRVRMLVKSLRVVGLRESVADAYRLRWARIAWALQSLSERMQRCYVCGESDCNSLCESCRRFVCTEHEDLQRTWEDCNICRECGDVIGPNCEVETAALSAEIGQGGE